MDDRSIEPMRSWRALPDTPLASGGVVTAAFSKAGARTYRDAARLVCHLLYGRTSSRANFIAVLEEGRGTCSSKHALLAQLAGEQMLPVALMLGIYLMNERNTPGVGRVLARHGLAEIPEAHCYLMHAGARIDVTREIESAAEPIAALLHEEEIAPSQAGPYKVRLHQELMQNLLAAGRLPGTRTFDEWWEIREKCIATLETTSI